MLPDLADTTPAWATSRTSRRPVRARRSTATRRPSRCATGSHRGWTRATRSMWAPTPRRCGRALSQLRLENARLDLATDHTTAAVATLDRLLDADPNDRPARLVRAEAFLAGGDAASALDGCGRRWRGRPGSTTPMSIGLRRGAPGVAGRDAAIAPGHRRRCRTFRSGGHSVPRTRGSIDGGLHVPATRGGGGCDAGGAVESLRPRDAAAQSAGASGEALGDAIARTGRRRVAPRRPRGLPRVQPL